MIRYPIFLASFFSGNQIEYKQKELSDLKLTALLFIYIQLSWFQLVKMMITYVISREVSSSRIVGK